MKIREADLSLENKLSWSFINNIESDQNAFYKLNFQGLHADIDKNKVYCLLNQGHSYGQI